MKKQARASFEIKSWDEKPYAEIEGASRLTRASVAKVYKGDLEGAGTVEYLMVYGHDGSASFVGIERVIGRIGDRRGNFVFQHVGTFKDGVASSTWVVVPGSGAGDLQGLRGEVHSALGHAKEYPVELHYELE
ncbi:MAG TPA: DUF3224 domain-containing protein [Myxococcaceae bacterium]|nr:DUF3224 domain-containing protein [Myxococcaceae bacterium]